jgi:preprotein translocase subunit SecF
MYNIIGTRKIWFSLSALLMIVSIVFIAIGGLKLGIDFKGGSLLQIKFEDNRPATQDVQNNLDKFELGDIVIQPVKDTELLIRMKDIGNDVREEILASLGEEFGTVQEMAFESIGPTIGKELTRKAIIAIIIVMLAIIAYVSWAFRKISSGPVPAYVFGLGAIVALAHDILIVTGIFAALGYFLDVEIGALFVTALLTILGFSVHDTIVVYHRTREGILKDSTADFKGILNTAINATLIRSLNTSITTLFVLVALYLFGGESIKYFVLALILGILLGTYSSIFIASPILLLWQRFFKNK